VSRELYRVLISEVSDLSEYSNQNLDIELDPALATKPEELIRRAAGKQAVVVRNVTKVNAALIAGLRDHGTVKIIGRLGVGLDNIDVKAAREAGMQVVYTPDANTESTAQFAFSQIMAATRRLAAAHESTARGEWNRAAFMGREMSELTVGIIGFGRIGSRLGAMLNFFGCQVIVVNDIPEAVKPPFTLVSMTELFSTADVISIHVPLLESTRGFVSPELLGLLRKNAVLVNSSRGEVIREAELDAFLRTRPDVTAVLDVRCSEPPADQLFRDLPNVRLSPHIAAFTTAAQKQVLSTVLDDVERFLAGGKPLWPAP
jgi:phosphoglycerate dehydrogenase-like enzyme